MRETKFRGIRISTNEWVYGYLVQRGETISRGQKTNKDDIVVPISYLSSVTYAIKPETSGQYTGLKDKNDVEVYEGDVVKQHYFYDARHPGTLGAMEVDREIIGVVGIDELGTYTVDSEGQVYYWLEYLEIAEQIEVIGDIHTNPELMEI